MVPTFSRYPSGTILLGKKTNLIQAHAQIDDLQVSSYKCGVDKIKLSRQLAQRINKLKMNEIQRKTPQ